MANGTSFIANVNTLASKIDIVTTANNTFNVDVLPVLQEVAALDLHEVTSDLKKGAFLGNRKLDIDLSLNVQGITAELKESDPAAAEAIWADVGSNVLYSSATITYTDGTVVELPFLSDNNPTDVSNSDGLLVQFNRTDVVAAVAQEDLIYSFTVVDSTLYTVTIDNIDYTYTTGAGATKGEIITGLTNKINSGVEPWTAHSETDNIRIVADIPGNSFITSVDASMLVRTDVANVSAGNYPTAFLDNLINTSFNSFTLDTVNNTVRFYDVIGSSSNIERIQLHTATTASSYIDSNPIYYWGKTTSALATLSMRAGDIIKLSNDIDDIILLANSIDQILAIQDRMPELVDTYIDGVPQGDSTIYNNLAELHEIYLQLTGIVDVYYDIRSGGDNYINTVATDLQSANTIGTVATDLNLGISSKISIVCSDIDSITTVANDKANIDTVVANISDVNVTSSNIADITAVSTDINSVVTASNNITDINAVSSDIVNINDVATSIVPNITEVLASADNAATATAQAAIATTQADIATNARNEIINISGDQVAQSLVSGSTPTAYYNSVTGKFTFGLPQGAKGDKGDSFTVNSVGVTSDRSLYDKQPQGFSFLDLTVREIYFKLSNTVADWSIGSPFGKGDTGNGIDSIVYTSSTGTAQGEAGETDTYTITFTDTTTTTFIVKNGAIPTKVDLGLGNVDNTADLDKPISTSTQTALDTKLNSSIYTAADILTKIKTVDGSSSGLDADLLDGMQPSDLPVSTATQTALDGKEPADATILKEADIGNTLQPLSNYISKNADYTAVANDFIYCDTTPIAQVDEVTVVNAVDSNVYAITVDGTLYSYTAGVSSTLATIADGLAALIPNGVSDGISVVTITATTAGTAQTVLVDGTTTVATDISITNTVANNVGSFTITLPATPLANDVIAILDNTSSFDTNPLTVARNGNNIMGLAQDVTIDIKNASIELIYDGVDWRYINLSSALTDAPIVVISNIVNENTTISGSYTSEANTAVTITATRGTISNHNTVAKTFDYTSYDITDETDGTDTISAYATKAGELKSNDTITNITVSYVPAEADTTIQVLDIYNDLETNTGFIGV